MLLVYIKSQKPTLLLNYLFKLNVNNTQSLACPPTRFLKFSLWRTNHLKTVFTPKQKINARFYNELQYVSFTNYASKLTVIHKNFWKLDVSFLTTPIYLKRNPKLLSLALTFRKYMGLTQYYTLTNFIHLLKLNILTQKYKVQYLHPKVTQPVLTLTKLSNLLYI